MTTVYLIAKEPSLCNHRVVKINHDFQKHIRDCYKALRITKIYLGIREKELLETYDLLDF